MRSDPSRAILSLDEFRHLLAEQLQVDESRVIPGASFIEDLLLDSIRLVDLWLRLEELGIQIPLEAAWDVQTVGEAYQRYLEQAAG